MIKYFLDEEAYMFLNEWSELFRTQTKWCPYYDRDSEVYLMGEGYDSLIGYFTAKSYGYKFNIVLKEDFPEIRKGQIAKGKITHKENSESDFDLIFDIRDKDDEKLKDVEIKLLQVFCTAFVEANCFMWYGNYVENKKYIAKGQNEGDDKVITFRKYKESIYAVPVGHHRSPEGVFKVRGHFRRYKNGKVIWIDEFLKGTD